MTNLIPQSAKKKVRIEYWTRVVTTWLFMLSVVLVVASLLLTPVNFLINYKIDIYSESASNASREVAEYDISSSVLVKSSKNASLILELETKQRFSEIINLIESLNNPGITITNFNLTRNKEQVAPVQLSGKAETREALAGFRETLLENREIETVFLPISNLARDKDITFTLTVTMKNK